MHRSIYPDFMRWVSTKVASRRAYHSPLSTAFLGLCVIGSVFVVTAPYFVPAYSIADPFDAGFHILISVAMACCLVAMYLASHTPAYRTCLFVFFLCAAIYVLFFWRFFSSYSVIVTIGVLSIVLYELYPLNLAICLMFVTGLSIAFAASVPAELADVSQAYSVGLTTGFSGIILALMGSLLSKSRVELVRQQHTSERLASNVVKLTEANISSLSLAASMEQVSRARERRRLTGEIHDLVGYTLTTNITLMEAVKVMAATEPARIPEYVEALRLNTEEALSEIRRVLRNLRADEEESLDLLNLLLKLKKVFAFSTGVEVVYEYGNVDFADLEPYREVVYHFVQEAMINAFRHGKAAHVTIFFWMNGEMIDVTVEDDGVGASLFEEDIGIRSMRERARQVGGSIRIPKVQNGFKIVLSVTKNGKYQGIQDATSDR